MTTDPATHSLDDLVRLTGFSKRQIRFYVTRKLVPGAGDRGPNAVYGEETLRRLKMIAVLKQKRIAPTGRAMTLDEIGHALDTLPDYGFDALINGWGDLQVLDTDARPGGALEEIAMPLMRTMSVARPREALTSYWKATNLEGGDEEDDLISLLERLRTLAAGLVSDNQPHAKAPGAASWSRVDSPDLEIHVRQPDSPAARARLDRMVRQLDRLLDRED